MERTLKKTVLIVILLVVVYAATRSGLLSTLSRNSPVSNFSGAGGSVSSDAVPPFEVEADRSNVQVQGAGTVIRVLADDNEGGRHQRFIIRLESGRTLLIAHNIDLARRLPALKVGDTVEYSGEYEWNNKGGVIHWTHHDPQGKHQSGWLKYKGRTYQ